MEKLDLFKELVWENIIFVAIELFIAKNPWLNVWPFRQILMWIGQGINEGLATVFQKLKVWADIQALILRKIELEKDFDRAAVTLKIVAQGAGIDSEEFKEARNVHKEKLNKAVRIKLVA